MENDVRENVAIHDPETYEDIKLNDSGNPRCPICGGNLRPTSRKESNNVWKCTNYERDEASNRKCPLIEAKFSKRRMMLWDCRYEPSTIF